jgi:hypothetical protein
MAPRTISGTVATITLHCTMPATMRRFRTAFSSKLLRLNVIILSRLMFVDFSEIKLLQKLRAVLGRVTREGGVHCI